MQQVAIPSPTLYYVPSAQNVKNPGVTPHFYLVAEDARGIRCECPAGQHGRRCWHAEAVIAGMVRPARPKAERCALCGRTDQRLIGSAGFMGTATDAKICRDYTGCADNRPWANP